MNVEIGAEAAQFPEKEYVNRIAVAVRRALSFLVQVIGIWTLEYPVQASTDCSPIIYIL